MVDIKRVNFEDFTFEELAQMIDNLHEPIISDGALIRVITQRVYSTEDVNVLQMYSLAFPIATELVRRIRTLLAAG